MVQIGGFVFEDDAQAVKAGRELDGIKYIRQKIDLDDPQKALQIYNKMVQEKVFETAVGYAFLYELQEELKMVPYIQKDNILPVVVVPASPEMKKEDRKMKPAEDAPEKAVKNTQNRKKTTKKSTEFRARFIASLIINFILAAALVAMLVISYIGENVTILNYENKIINRYEQWEQDLDEREKAVSEYEQKYGIENKK